MKTFEYIPLGTVRSVINRGIVQSIWISKCTYYTATATATATGHLFHLCDFNLNQFTHIIHANFFFLFSTLNSSSFFFLFRIIILSIQLRENNMEDQFKHRITINKLK